MVDDIFEAATVEKRETFEEIVLRVQNQLRSTSDLLMKCSNCDFEAFDKEDYYDHIVDNHAIDDNIEREADASGTNIEEESLNNVEELIEFDPKDDNDKDDEGGVVQRILDSILNKVVDVVAKRKEWEERLKNILPNKNPNLLFSTLGSSQEPFDDEENGESESDSEEESSSEENEVEKKEASSGLVDSLEVLKEQEKYLLDNIVKDLVELESLDIDIVGGRAGLKVKEEEEEETKIKEEREDFWENVTDFQDQYQIFAENLINPMENAEKKNSKRKKLKAMSKKKKKMKRMKEAMDDDEEEEEEENELLATSSEVLRGLLASPANCIGR